MKETTIELAKEILREHEIVKELIRELGQTIDKEALDGPEPKWTCRLREELVVFRSHLERHFALEEEGGFMTELLTLMPQAFQRIEQLREEHGQILRALDQLIPRIDSLASEVAKEFTEFRSQFSQILSVVRHHEGEENELIQSAYFEDIGPAD